MAEPLQLSFAADTEKANQAIAQLAGTVTTNMLKIGKSMRDAYDETSKLKTVLNLIPNEIKLAAAAFIAFEVAKLAFKAVSAAIDEAQEKLKELVGIAQQARSAGVGTDLFQRWTSNAKELNTTVEKLAATLQHARDASEITIGEGGEKSQSAIAARLAEHAKAGNIGAGDVDTFNDAKMIEDKYRVILALLEKLASESKNIAAFDIAGKFFGKDFENQMRRGEDVVGKMRASLNGVTQAKWPPEMIERAEQLNTEIERAKRGIGEAFLPLQRDVAKGQLDLIKYTKEWWEFLERVAKTAAGIYQWFSDIQDKLSKILDNEFFRKIDGIQRWINEHVGEAGVAFGTALGLRKEQYDPSLMGEYGPGGSGAPRRLPEITTDDASKGLPKKNTTEQTKELDTLMDQLKKSVAVLEAENAAYNKSNTEKQIAIDLAKAEEAARRDAENDKRKSKELTEDETASVIKYAKAMGVAKDRSEDLNRATAGANARAAFFGEQLLSVFDKIGVKGTRIKDIILDLAKAIEKAALQALILGQGPLANLFGTEGRGGGAGGLAGMVFGSKGFFSGIGGGSSFGAADYTSMAAAAAPGSYGPGFADGGIVGRGGTPMFIPFASLMNARHFQSGGAVPAIVHEGELILNQAQQKNLADSMRGGPIQLTHAPTISGLGLSKEETYAVLQRSQKEFARQIGPIFANWQRRHA